MLNKGDFIVGGILWVVSDIVAGVGSIRYEVRMIHKFTDNLGQAERAIYDYLQIMRQTKFGGISRSLVRHLGKEISKEEASEALQVLFGPTT